MTLNEKIKLIRAELSDIYDPNEIQSFIYLIFDHLLNYSKIDIHLNKDKKIETDVLKSMDVITQRLKSQEPIQYILGEAHFFDLMFKIDSNVLIPRQETEELVQLIISENLGELKILDIGTGSGCIAVSLAKNLPKSRLYALDISSLALQVAKKNSDINETKVHFEEFDLLKSDPIEVFQNVCFDIIVSNPPYVMEKEKVQMKKNVLEHEPESALFVDDNDPLVYYRKLEEFAAQRLTQKGKIYMEINEALGIETTAIFKNKNYESVEIIKDINEKDRMIRAIKN